MRAVLVDVRDDQLAERRRLGHDRWDEMWEGVLHMVPPPSDLHQRIGTRLVQLLGPLADERGLVLSYETGLFRPGVEDDYRTPDLVVTRPEVRTERGVDGPAELAVEIRSPNDEAYEKIPFYESMGVRELLIIEPLDREVELYVLRGKRLRLVQPDASGAVRLGSLDVTIRTVEGPRLRLQWSSGAADI